MTTAWLWPDGPPCPVLGDADVHVWRIALDVAPHERAVLARHLSTEERERAGRFVRERDHDRFVAAHGAVRALLAGYLDASPWDVRFRVGDFGKPSLEHDGTHGDLRFNMAHSEGLALCAVTRGRAVGVDVEWMRAMPDLAQIAARFFSRRECAALRAVPAPLRTAAFYACWSRKEAYIKGVGLGLSLPLDSFDVSVAPGEPAALIAVRGDAGAAGPTWVLHELYPADGYAAAVAVEGSACEITRWHWHASRN